MPSEVTHDLIRILAFFIAEEAQVPVKRRMKNPFTNEEGSSFFNELDFVSRPHTEFVADLLGYGELSCAGQFSSTNSHVYPLFIFHPGRSYILRRIALFTSMSKRLQAVFI
jgi:hypothetical protein